MELVFSYSPNYTVEVPRRPLIDRFDLIRYVGKGLGYPETHNSFIKIHYLNVVWYIWLIFLRKLSRPQWVSQLCLLLSEIVRTKDIGPALRERVNLDSH